MAIDVHLAREVVPEVLLYHLMSFHRGPATRWGHRHRRLGSWREASCGPPSSLTVPPPTGSSWPAFRPQRTPPSSHSHALPARAKTVSHVLAPIFTRLPATVRFLRGGRADTPTASVPSSPWMTELCSRNRCGVQINAGASSPGLFPSPGRRQPAVSCSRVTTCATLSRKKASSRSKIDFCLYLYLPFGFRLAMARTAWPGRRIAVRQRQSDGGYGIGHHRGQRPSMRATKADGKTPSALQRRKSTVSVGDFFPRSSMLTYVRCYPGAKRQLLLAQPC